MAAPRLTVAAAFVALAWLGGPAPAGTRSVVVSPDWLRRPSLADLQRHYPSDALGRGLGGKVVLECGILADGRFDICRVLSERPAAAGFAEAALRMARLYQMKPTTRDGEPVAGAIVAIPIEFGGPGQLPPGAGASEDPDPYGRVLITPTWRSWPNHAQVLLASPQAARDKGLKGHATFRCLITAVGALQHCALVSEEPKGLGFAAGARKLTHLFRISTKTETGYPVTGAAVYLTVSFPNLGIPETPPVF